MSSPGGNRAEESTWQYGPASTYKAPQSAPREQVSSRLRSAWQRFWNRDNPRSRSVEERTDFSALPDSLLEELLPELDWKASSAALEGVLQDWLHDSDPRKRGTAVIGPPGSGVKEAVTRWGEQRAGRLVAPPEVERILDPRVDWWQSVDTDLSEILVIPELERFFLRHHDGLDLVRQLIQRLWVSPRRACLPLART